MIRRVNLFLILYIAVACYSCQPDITKQNQEWIIGEWTPIFYDDIYGVYSCAGYLFDKEFCENKVGYYDYFYQTGKLLEFPDVLPKLESEFCGWFDNPYLCNVKRPYGYRTNYKIEKDTLHIFDLADKVWTKYHLRFSSKDTMILSNKYFGDTIPDRFVRKVYQADSTPLMDQFIAYYPYNCYSKSKLYLIRRDGLFFSYGYYDSNRFFIGQLRNDEFNRLETLFKRADLATDLGQWESINRIKMDDLYPMSEETFIMDNKVVTFDNLLLGNMAFISAEFYWAYLAGLFLPDLAKIKPCHKDDYPKLLDEFDDFLYIRLKSRNLIFSLSATECFYLGVLLCYAEEVEGIAFEPSYMLSGFRDEKKTMQTDGRYFRYKKNNGKEVTLDIGFNFVEVNELEKNKAYPVWR